MVAVACFFGCENQWNVPWNTYTRRKALKDVLAVIISLWDSKSEKKNPFTFVSFLSS